MKKIAILFATTVFATTGFATQVQAAGAQTSLCQSQEEVLFACSTGKKIISVCASDDFSAHSGYVQYRFGTKKKIELAFPEQPGHPSTFATGGTITYAGGGAAYMRFNNGAHSYVVYSGMGRGWDKQGVVVEKRGKMLVNILCKTPSVEKFDATFFENNGIPTDETDFTIP
ncbi:MAG: hypothetical protein ACRDBT_08985 [Aeromonas sp.]